MSFSRHNVATLRHTLGITASVRRPQTREPCLREKKWGLGNGELSYCLFLTSASGSTQEGRALESEVWGWGTRQTCLLELPLLFQPRKALGMRLQTSSVCIRLSQQIQGDKLREAGGAGGDSIKLLGFSLPWEKPVGSPPTLIL